MNKIKEIILTILSYILTPYGILITLCLVNEILINNIK